MEIWKSKIYAKFFDMLRECKRLKRWWFYFKAARELVKEKYPEEASTFKLLYWRFKGFCRHKYPYEEKPMQPKSHQQLCVMLLRTFVNSFYRSEKESIL